METPDKVSKMYVYWQVLRDMLGRAGGEEGITTVSIVAGKELSEKLILG